MMLYITRDGQRLGPYTPEQVRGFLAVGTVQLTDWAWHEGLADWVPLQQVAGFGSSAPPASAPTVVGAQTAVAPGARPPRPVLVWIICLFYFIMTPLSVGALALMPTLLNFSSHQLDQAEASIHRTLDQQTDPAVQEKMMTVEKQLEDTRAVLAQQKARGLGFYAFSIGATLLNFVSATFLFLLRRPALYLFGAAFVLGVIGTIYNFATMNLLSSQGVTQVAGMAIGLVVGWGLGVAILLYVWHLFRRGVLR